MHYKYNLLCCFVIHFWLVNIILISRSSSAGLEIERSRVRVPAGAPEECFSPESAFSVFHRGNEDGSEEEEEEEKKKKKKKSHSVAKLSRNMYFQYFINFLREILVALPG